MNVCLIGLNFHCKHLLNGILLIMEETKFKVILVKHFFFTFMLPLEKIGVM